MMRKKIFYLILLFLLAHIASYAQSVDFSSAYWIGDAISLPTTDSLFYNDDPAPIFRKVFVLKESIKKVTFSITAAGYYSATINTVQLDKNYCDPAWTNFSKRIYYTEYDITNQVYTGYNCIGVTLGNGFYNPLPMKFWGNLNLRNSLPTGRPVFIAKVKIEYVSGKTQELVTDRNWKYSYGPIIRNNVYLGEVYDARKAIIDWNNSNFDDSKWNFSSEKSGPGGKLQKTFFPYIQEIDLRNPVKITSIKYGKFIADMGVNSTGTFRIRLQGKMGDTIRFRFGERIYDNGELNPMTAVAGQIKEKGKGGPGAPDLAVQGGMYIFGRDTTAWYSPAFSFRVFRYMEIDGLKKKPTTSDIQGIALSTNVDRKNSFSCSSILMNSIQDATSRTFLSNLMSVQSDCPGREKFGYGGDIYATNEAFINNFNMHAIYRKILYDWVDEVSDSIFIDTAPYIGLKYCGLNFEASIIDLQYNLYKYYGDSAILREMYDFDLRWMDKAARMTPTGIVDKGLADHESLTNVPVELTGTAAYLNSAIIMRKISVLMGDKKNEERFTELVSKIKNGMLNMYWTNASMDLINKQSREASMRYINKLPEKEKKDATERLKNSKELFNKQTLYAVLLYFDVVPEKDRNAAIDSLLKAIDKAPAKHFTTGIFGTKYILEALSRNGYANRVFDIVNSTAFPGWGFMVDHGATTLWETWKESDDIYSNCHPMFGSVSCWIYRYLGGIQADENAAGFKRFSISPIVPQNLNFMNCNFECPYGTIIANWKKSGNTIVFSLTIPKGTTANFKLPFQSSKKITIKKLMDKTSSFKRFENEVLVLKEGKYEITSKSIN